MDILCFWGKARPRDADRGPQWHPLAFHSLDVAAVGARDRKLGDRLSRLLGLPGEDTLRLARFLLSLHDLGKFARNFQAKAPAHDPRCLEDGTGLPPTSYDHGAGGLRLFLADCWSFKLTDANRYGAWLPLVSAVTGHHGAPPVQRTSESLLNLRPDFGKKGIEAAHAFIGQAHELLFMPASSAPSRECARHASFAFAGLAVLADWIGSPIARRPASPIWRRIGAMHGNERTATDPTKEAQQEEEKKQALDEVLPETVVIDGKEVTKKDLLDQIKNYPALQSKLTQNQQQLSEVRGQVTLLTEQAAAQQAARLRK